MHNSIYYATMLDYVATECCVRLIKALGISCYTNNECFHSCNGKNIFIR